MTLLQAAKKALEALEWSWGGEPLPTREWEAMQDLRKAIEEAELFGNSQQLEWVGLTDEEIAEAVGSPVDEVYLSDFRKVEAKSRSKNGY